MPKKDIDVWKRIFATHGSMPPFKKQGVFSGREIVAREGGAYFGERDSGKRGPYLGEGRAIWQVGHWRLLSFLVRVV